MAKRIAVLGGGPIGIETALLLSRRGHDVVVYERGAPGAHVARWSHVRLFTPWEMNRSPWGEAAIQAAGGELLDGYPTGGEYLRSYLRPLTEATELRGRVRPLTEVVGVARRDAFKGEHIGSAERDAGPFLLALQTPDGAEWAEAEIVIDSTGVYQRPRAMGPRGLPAIGEQAAGGAIERWIPDVLDRDRDHYAARTTVVVGDGYSAVTTVHLLHELHLEEPRTRVVWLRAGTDAPYTIDPEDPLPQRVEIAEFGNRAAAGGVEGVTAVGGVMVRGVVSTGDRWQVDVGDEVFDVDRIVSNTGYRPDWDLTRELQVHHCWASEGPMKLAATLLASAGADCLDQVMPGIDTMRSPEPGFWVLGAKSYGRNSNFLLRVGLEQAEALADELG